jgi:cellulose synthase/poly-beta-1,6-N-acetylglucosamine synthase-like glycosyltransferase
MVAVYLALHAFKAFSRKLLVAGVRPWASHYLSLVLQVIIFLCFLLGKSLSFLPNKIINKSVDLAY